MNNDNKNMNVLPNRSLNEAGISSAVSQELVSSVAEKGMTVLNI